MSEATLNPILLKMVDTIQREYLSCDLVVLSVFANKYFLTYRKQVLMNKLAFLRRTLLTTISILVVLLSSVALGQSQMKHSKLDLISEVTSVAEGSTFSVAITLDPDPGWHVYWKNPGDNGKAPSETWTLPEGFTAGELQYTVPSFVPFGEYMSYGYNDKALFITEIKTPVDFDGPIKIECSVSWLICDDSLCVPESGKVSLSIPKGSGENLSTWHDDFEAARAKHPQKVDWKAEFVTTEESVELEIQIPKDVGDVSDVWFFPAAQKLINHAQPQSIGVENSVIRIKSVAGIRFGRYEEIVGVLRTVPSSAKEKPRSFEFQAQRVKQLTEWDLDAMSTRSPTDIKALSASH